MNELVVDIETNGLLREENGKPAMDRVHLIVTSRPDGTGTAVFHDDPRFPRTGALKDGVRAVESADLAIGHNVDGFDVPALRKFCGLRKVPPTYDTLTKARLMFPWVGDTDGARYSKGFPRKLTGSQSLEAWGWRMGLHKGTPPQDWSALTADMIDYCVRDVAVCADLYRHLVAQKWDPRSEDLEDAFAGDIRTMCERGVAFDYAGAMSLVGTLKSKLHTVAMQLEAELGTWVEEKTSPVKKIKSKKVHQVNPGSRKQVVAALQRNYGWVPREYTPQGTPKLDEAVVTAMDPKEVPVQPLLLDFFLLKKRIGQIADGPQGWVKRAKRVGDHYRIFPFVNHNGATTGRCTHRGPNLAQVPRVSSPYGRECRALFTASPGLAMVGCDMSGIEARILAHYLHAYDGGAAIRKVTDGDIHGSNLEAIQKVAPGATRDDAKTVLYATMYGALGKRIAQTLGLPERQGSAVRQALLDGLPGLERLIVDIQGDERAGVRGVLQTRGWLKGLDGRRLRPRRAFAGLNTLIQGAGAVVMKEATRIANRGTARALGDMVLHVHDEFQFECAPASAEALGSGLVSSIEKAGKNLEVLCPLTGEYKIGKTWADTH